MGTIIDNVGEVADVAALALGFAMALIIDSKYSKARLCQPKARATHEHAALHAIP